MRDTLVYSQSFFNMRLKSILQWGYKELIGHSESAYLDAELLLSYVLNQSNTFLLAHDDYEPGFFVLWRYRRLIKKRRKGLPVSYLTGHKEFYLLDFEVNRYVLVPRPDTEILVESVISYLLSHISNPKPQTKIKTQIPNPKQKFQALLLDIGTGSGCIPISILKNVSGIKAVVTEISRPALRVARRNIKKHHLKSRIKLVRSDLLSNVSSRIFEGYEVVVTANLPYIPTDFDIHSSTKFEPDISLYGGKDGLDVYERLIKQLKELKPKAIFLELFEFQIATVAMKLPDYELKYVKNMTGEARVLMMERVD